MERKLVHSETYKNQEIKIFIDSAGWYYNEFDSKPYMFITDAVLYAKWHIKIL